eukprot:CAMPEP_0206457136 /NCGR_PEP_ID=MMETSP0324_2-20121206/22785_1 /ASSEMBLY_ACC=CAM_ASM_000836 /TAXON_ID=2866 /ORGANISM="Crypthecodinium cohnii, Strain Seligo" /LENGTH=309 /DNA_ID=CAMNT_0053928207 /DNA_START=103 /DNA_END=1029 /DNA_ORIENTATION=+
MAVAFVGGSSGSTPRYETDRERQSSQGAGSNASYEREIRDRALEILRVCHIGGPLTCQSAGPTEEPGMPRMPMKGRRSNSPSPDTCEFLFEVRSNLEGRGPWHVQRSHAAIANLHICLQSSYPGFNLPILPAAKSRKMQKLFQSEDRRLQELAVELETYLNTLLALPVFRDCQVLKNFLDVPSMPHENTAEDVGVAAAEVITGCGHACKGFFRRLFRRCLERQGGSDGGEDGWGARDWTRNMRASLSESFRSEETVVRQDRGSEARARLADFVERSRAQTRSHEEQNVASITGVTREIHIPLDSRLREW